MSTMIESKTHSAQTAHRRRRLPPWAEELASLAELTAQVLSRLVRGRHSKRHRAGMTYELDKLKPDSLLLQLYVFGNRSLVFMTVTMAVIGIILVYQSGLQAMRVVPDMSMLGATFTKFLVRDLGPSIGAMPLATRVGAGIAAEIGSMEVTDQVDALRMSGADPVDYLVVPRVLASTIVSTAVLIWSTAVAWLAGQQTASLLFDVNLRTFANLGMISTADIVVGLTKCVSYGAAIALVSAHRGLRTYGGSEGVGRATTQAVVYSCFAIIVLNFIISTAAHFIAPT